MPGAEFIVRVATALVAAVPIPLLATSLNLAPLSLALVEARL